MILKRFFHEGLAQASWLIGCDRTGEAIVVDPNRNVDQYLNFARTKQLRIVYVTETHIHADFVSGCRELARRAGATLLLSAEGGDEWAYRFATGDGATLLHDGDVVRVGRVRVDVRHTPGHTPEHLSFLVTDEAASAAPIGILTGDFVFVGDVGRPDLLERVANAARTMEPSARQLFASLRKFRELPDSLQVWPGHGAGSACGRSLGSMPQSTVGYERIANWALAEMDEARFVGAVLEDQPDPPPYFAEMKRVNRSGPLVVGDRPPVRALDVSTLENVLRSGEVLVDIRRAEQYASRHVRGALNIPLNRKFTTWAGWFVPIGRDVHLVADAPEDADRAVRELALIGLDRVAGVFLPYVLGTWRSQGNPLEELLPISSSEVLEHVQGGKATVIDVRDDVEWSAGHVTGARHIPIAHLAEHLDALPRDRPIVVYCETGSRSAVAASLLQSRGFSDVRDYGRGFEEWSKKGMPVSKE